MRIPPPGPPRPAPGDGTDGLAAAAVPVSGVDGMHDRPRRGLFSSLLEARLPAFKPPMRINGRIGYALGPKRAPKLPAAGEGRPPAAPPQSAASTPPSPQRSPASVDAWLEANWPFEAAGHRPVDLDLPPPSSASASASATPARGSPSPLRADPSRLSGPPTVAHVREWQHMSDRQRSDIGLAGYAQAHGLSLHSWKNMVRADGRVLPKGQQMLDKAAGKVHRAPTAEHLREWQGMPEADRLRIGITRYAQTHDLNLNTWRNLVRRDGTLRLQAQMMLDKAQGTLHRSARVEHVREWQAMSQQERDRVGILGYAQAHGLNAHSWRNTVRRDGLPRMAGQALLDRATGATHRHVTAAHVLEWRAMSAQQRAAIGVDGYAAAHTLHPRAWRKAVRIDGQVQARGQVLIDKAEGRPYRRSSAENVREWQHMSPQQRDAVGGVEGYAREKGLNPSAWRAYVRKDGSPRIPGQRQLDRSDAMAACEAAQASTPAEATARPIADMHLLRWRNMTQAERDAMGLAHYAAEHGLPMAAWRALVNADGTLTPDGEALVNRPGPSSRRT